ncbi:MAG: acylneuraminate cytidylyltransferase, partial [bacterium]|nr:acylneuraminate cytidylyltransferase [bacterium]
MRRLVAVLACRMESSRLYAKPLQRLCEGVSILDQILATLSRFPCIHQVVLGISRKPGNGAFKELAQRRAAGWVWGDPDDVLGRVISCGEHAEATDIFHVTSENPFLCHEMVEEACEK